MIRYADMDDLLRAKREILRDIAQAARKAVQIIIINDIHGKPQYRIETINQQAFVDALECLADPPTPRGNETYEGPAIKGEDVEKP